MLPLVSGSQLLIRHSLLVRYIKDFKSPVRYQSCRFLCAQSTWRLDSKDHKQRSCLPLPFPFCSIFIVQSVASQQQLSAPCGSGCGWLTSLIDPPSLETLSCCFGTEKETRHLYGRIYFKTSMIFKPKSLSKPKKKRIVSPYCNISPTIVQTLNQTYV